MDFWRNTTKTASSLSKILLLSEYPSAHPDGSASYGSFENFDYNDRGKTVDLRLVRDRQQQYHPHRISAAEEAAGIIAICMIPVRYCRGKHYTPPFRWFHPPAPSMNTEPAVVDLNRLTRAEVSRQSPKSPDTCEDGRWYVIELTAANISTTTACPITYAYEPRIHRHEKGDLITVTLWISSQFTHSLQNEIRNRYVLLLLLHPG